MAKKKENTTKEKVKRQVKKKKDTGIVLADKAILEVDKREAEQAADAKIEKIKQATPVQGKKLFNKYNVKSLNELLKENRSPYGEQTYEQYEELLKGMTFLEMERHATEVNIIPRGNKPDMQRQLLKEFQARSSPYHNVVVPQPVKFDKISKDVLRILSEGQ